ncbi:MAG: hypothetical protein IKF01_04045 [Bacilli bacterium]|nr:hypothetical protein [Bacilli bacterium]
MKCMKKNFKIFVFLFVCTIFFGVSDVHALSNIGSTGTGYTKNESEREYSIKSNGKEFSADCVNFNAFDPYEISYKAVSLNELFSSMRDACGKSNFDSGQLDEKVKKLGGIKYYFSKILKKRNRITQTAMWKFLVEAGLLNDVHSDDNGRNWLAVRIAEINNFNPMYNDAKKWYENNKGSIKVSAVGWIPTSVTERCEQELIELEVEYSAADYSLDIACENCDSEVPDSKAIVIQDSTNWDDIKRSSEISDNDRQCKGLKLKNYYKKTNDGTYCREEYHVYYPTYNKVTKKLRAITGRYFTVNAKGEKDLTEAEKNSGVKSLEVLEDNILNFAPIKVTKVRQCQGGNISEYSQNNDISECSGGDSNGDIIINYNETKNGGYSYKGKLKTYGCKVETPRLENGMLTQSRTCSYTLDENVYRYIRMSDGKSIEDGDNIDKQKNAYKDVGISNLPVSMSNSEKVSNTIASVQFQYDLPSCSNLKKVYDDGGNCFNNKKDNEDNIYKKYRNKKTIENDNINNTACVKLYGNSELGKSNSNVEKCISDRQTNKFGDKDKNCIDKNKIGKTDNYVCEINKCESADEAEALKVAWNPKEKYCCAPGQSYIKQTGKCEDSGKPTPVCVGSDCKPTPECVENGDMTNCEEGYTCNTDTKKCVPDKPKSKCDLLGCGDACCEGADGHAYCGVNINGEVLCAGKPTPINGELGVYRTIDPTSPFTNQEGTTRETGDNWCNYNVDGKDCSTTYKNAVVNTVVSKNSNKTEENAMYKVELDSKMINEIRKYNKNNSYDDFTLKCDSKGDNCKIKKFKEKTGLAFEGKCANASGTSFESCSRD